MNTILILYPYEFNCQSKLNRKLSNITQNMASYRLIALDDPRGLLGSYAQECGISLSILSADSLAECDFSHAIVFDDGEVFVDELQFIQAHGIPVRLIKIDITRVINIKNNPELSSVDSSEEYQYIGRGSYWGNPHSMYESMEDSDEDPREAVIRMYKYDFDYDKFLNIDKNKVFELAGKRLGCFCKPNACHGDILADFLNQWDDGK